MHRLTLLALAFIFTTICVALVATGGFVTSIFGLRLSARSPVAAGIAAAAALIGWMVVASRSKSMTADAAAVEGWIERRSIWLVATIAAVAGAVAMRFHTYSASGADPSGYLSEAALLASGALEYVEPLRALADWRDGASTLAPLGWRAADGPLQVPTYAVGLPLLMLVPHAVAGALGASLVVCGAAALAVFCAGQLARTLAGGAAGVVAAAWVATLPISLYQSFQPMSDVPASAAWLACWWLIGKAEKGSDLVCAGAGAFAAMAVLVRPNLAPLAAVPALYLVMRHRRLITALTFAMPVAIAGVVTAYLQARWFGSPLRSGYGSALEIYSLANVLPNAAVYLRWTLDTHGPLLLAAPLALLVVRQRFLAWLIAFGIVVCGAYFIYGEFESWPYLRFLLPAMSIAAVAVSAGATMWVRRFPVVARLPLLAVFAMTMTAWQVSTARELRVFGLDQRQARALLAGEYLAASLPPNAVLVSGEQSGAMRYYSGRTIVRWDFLDQAALDRVLERLSASAHDVWFVLDDWEVALFRERFAGAALDWPPALDAGIERRTLAWRLRDRARFVSGGSVATDRVR